TDLAALSAIEIDTANSIHGLNGATHLLVGDFGQFAAAHRAADEKRHDGIRLRIQLGNDGRKGVARQPVNSSGNFFTDVLCSALDVAFKDKRAGNIGKAFEGIDGDFVNAAHRRDGIFQRQDHTCNDLFRGRSRQPDFHVYSGRVGFGKKVDGQAPVGEHTQRHEKRNQHHREDGILYAGFGELHRFISSSTQMDMLIFARWDYFAAGAVPSGCSRTMDPSRKSPEMATATLSPGFSPSATSKRRPCSSSVWPAGRICRSETRLPFSRNTL